MNDFWEKVNKCKHNNVSLHDCYIGTCSTPHCGTITEYHCLDCGVFVSECGCGSNSGLDGWSYDRRKAHEYKNPTQQEVG